MGQQDDGPAAVGSRPEREDLAMSIDAKTTLYCWTMLVVYLLAWATNL